MYEGRGGQGLELQNGAITLVGPATSVIQRNNFHNASLGEITLLAFTLYALNPVSMPSLPPFSVSVPSLPPFLSLCPLFPLFLSLCPLFTLFRSLCPLSPLLQSLYTPYPLKCTAALFGVFYS